MSMQNISAKTSGNTSGFCQDIKGVPKCTKQLILIIVCTKSLYTMVKRKKVIICFSIDVTEWYISLVLYDS